MLNYKAKPVIITLLLLLFQPIPTPTPALADSDISKIVNDVNNSVLSLVVQGGVLAVVALAIVAFIIWLVFGRNRGKEYQTLINEQVKHNEAVRESLQDEIKDLRKELGDERAARNKLLETNKAEITMLQEDYRLENFKRDERMIETFKANMDVLTAFTDKVKTNEAEIIEVKKVLTIGSPMVKEIGKKVDEVLTTVAEIREAITKTPASESASLGTQITELNLAISALKGVVERLEKHKTDSKPIVKLGTEVTPSEATS